MREIKRPNPFNEAINHFIGGSFAGIISIVSLNHASNVFEKEVQKQTTIDLSTQLIKQYEPWINNYESSQKAFDSELNYNFEILGELTNSKDLSDSTRNTLIQKLDQSDSILDIQLDVEREAYAHPSYQQYLKTGEFLESNMPKNMDPLISDAYLAFGVFAAVVTYHKMKTALQWITGKKQQ